MHDFRPLRSSTPPRTRSRHPATSIVQSTLSGDGSRTSAAPTVPELAGLSTGDVEIIDAIIDRAGPSANTFLTVFKAYSDILQERGLDPHEVLYYGKLLKLGTLKGQSWRDKWAMIKAQHGYNDITQTDASIPAPAVAFPRQPAFRLPAPRRPPALTEDSFTVHSHENEDEDDNESERASSPTPIRRARSPLYRETAPEVSSNSLGLEFTNHPLLSVPTSAPHTRTPLPSRTQRPPWAAGPSSDATEDAVNLPRPGSIPPSYRAAVRDLPPSRQSSVSPLHKLAQLKNRPQSSPVIPPFVDDKHTKPRRNVINEDDAWKKVRMAQDEEIADGFRRDKLVEKCWLVWRESFEWIQTTHEQIAHARDNLVLRVNLQTWRQRTAARMELHKRVDHFADSKRLKVAMKIWKLQMRKHQQTAWRNSMRQKMKIVRDRHAANLRRDVWFTWRQAFETYKADNQYQARLVLRFYQRWKTRVSKVEVLESRADDLYQQSLLRRGEDLWRHWVRRTRLLTLEKRVADQANLRILDSAVQRWRGRLFEARQAQDYHDALVLKHTLKSWRTARERIKALEAKADRHVARQDDVLLRAVCKVWKAHERGRLLVQVRKVRLIQNTWVLWKQRMRSLAVMEDHAAKFQSRVRGSGIVSSMETWKRALSTHRNSHAFAVQYYSSRLSAQMVHNWKNAFLNHLRLMKQGRVVEKYLILRRTWNTLKEKLAEGRRAKLLRKFETNKLQHVFNKWAQRTVMEKHLKLAEEAAKRRITMRLLQSSLRHWTNRVIERKLQELEVVQRFEVTLLTNVMKKWKGIVSRHAEELRLMESYQDVKREEIARKMFYKWITAARSTRRRRLLLEEKEAELKISMIASTWDKWRYRFKEEKLRPLESTFILQGQKFAEFKAFGIWHARTKSLPAIRFHASQTKARHWAIWRAAMPHALQAKQAREKDQRSLLAWAIRKWGQSYKTKKALKAIARARYLQLPSAVPRISGQRPPSAWPTTTGPSRPSFFPRRPPVLLESRQTDEEEETESEAPEPPAPIAGRSRYAISSASNVVRPRSEASPPRRARGHTTSAVPLVRAPSPARSTKSSISPWAGREPHARTASPAPSTTEGRSRLWMELRDIQTKTRPQSRS